ncbi:MAG TPA: CoA ester lyase [Caldilineaceae bacterium]|nr:CoA ester lyase [Caldilineaceae bacterium]
MREERARRALLFIPGDSERKIAKGATLGVDSIILDLEDAVAPAHKAAAREQVRRALLSGPLRAAPSERLVRVNAAPAGDRAALEMQAQDIALTVQGHPDGYLIPKVEAARDVARVADMLLAHEAVLGLPLGQIKLLALIESTRGVVHLQEIAQADERLVALLFGAEDLAADLGAVRSAAGDEVAYARSAVALYAAAFGLQAIDTPFVDLADLDGLRAEAQQAARMGYSGKLAIHPAQIAPIVEAFTPGEAEIEAARRLIAAYQAHQQQGAGVFAYGGKMVDRPMLRAAERVLARARAAGKLV